MEQIFFKTVRRDGSSVWAIGSYRTIYKIGQRYQFDAATPAHVFGFKDGAIASADACEFYPKQNVFNYDWIYGNRAEPAGTRVLIGYGVVNREKVPVCSVTSNWDFSQAVHRSRFVSRDFTIIGEVKPSHRLDRQEEPFHLSYCVYGDLKL